MSSFKIKKFLTKENSLALMIDQVNLLIRFFSAKKAQSSFLPLEACGWSLFSPKRFTIERTLCVLVIGYFCVGLNVRRR